MLGDLLHQFTGSPQGDEALQTLKDQHGLSGEQAKSALEAAASGVTNAVGSDEGGGLGALGKAIGGGGGVLGALGGLAGSGGGLASALQGGLGGAAAEKIAEVIAPTIGIDKAKATAIASTVLPYIVKFLQSRGATGGEQGGGEQQGGGGGGLGDVLGGAMKKLF
jgi:hypothetical protein